MPTFASFKPQCSVSTSTKKFYQGCEGISTTIRFLVYPGKESYSIFKDVTAISLIDKMQEIRDI